MRFALISVSINRDISQKTNPNFNPGIDAPRHISDGSSTPKSSANFNRTFCHFFRIFCATYPNKSG
jgi:hypothetical protein